MSEDDYNPNIISKTLWCIATADEPITTSEVRDRIDENRHTISCHLYRLNEAGLVSRQPRLSPGGGQTPYEYTINEDYDP